MESRNIVLVIGGNRGIGYNLVRVFLNHGWKVYASIRPQTRDDKSVKELRTTEASILELDMTDEASVEAASKEFQEGKLDVLVNCAGVDPNPLLWQDHTPQILLEKLAVNVVGPFTTIKHFYKHLEKSQSGKIINMSSNMGSMGDNVRGRNLAYKVSKAALNQLTVNMARDFVRDEANVTANAIHPGWIPTKVSGFTGPDDMQEVVDSIVETIIRLGSSDNGRFMDRHGSDMAF